VVIPRDQLGPLRSVRLRNHDSDKDPTKRRRRNRVLVLTKPSGAKVYYRGKLLGVTPLTIDANGRTTPMDIVIRARGFMVLRTRIQRNERRTYAFQLTPSKFN